MSSPVRCISSKPVYIDKWLRLYSDTIQQPDGKEYSRNVIRTKSGAGAVAINKSEEICLVVQYRYPIDCYSLEIPKGAFDSFDSSETPLSVAKRELKEETGITAATWTELSLIHTMTGYSDDGVYLFLATDLEIGLSTPDETEYIEPLFVPLRDLKTIIASGIDINGERIRMTDATSIAAISLAQQII